MLPKFSFFAILVLFLNKSFSQNQSNDLNVRLYLKNNSSVYEFFYSYIVGSHIKNPELAKVPEGLLKSYTLSRFLDLKALNVRVPVLIGVAKNGYPVIIFDKNNNKDLRDDSVFYFYDTLRNAREGNYKTITINAVNNVQITFEYGIVKPPELNFYTGSSLEDSFFLAIRPSEYRFGEFELNNKMIQVYFLTPNLYHFDREGSYIIITGENQGNLSDSAFLATQKKYKLGDKIDVENTHFLIKSISSIADELTLERLADNSSEGVNTGFTALSFTEVSLAGKPIDLKSQRGHYVLLDYWGTWCGPCKTVLPDLKTFQQKFPKLKMIGVALDNDINQVRQFIKKNSINWEQVFVNKNKADSNSLCAKYKVENYPTFIVINPEGKIVFRDMGIDGFNRLEAYLDKIAF